MPTVTVAIPTYNRAKLLRRAISSVLGQTFEDFEIVIADDASDDGTSEMVSSIGDSRVRYIRHPQNRGVASARNTTVANASGKYIAFLDDDDEWLPEKLRSQVDAIERAGRNVGAVLCGYYDVEVSSNRIVKESMPSRRGWMFESFLTEGLVIHTSSLLVKAACFERVGLFDTSLPFGEDRDMWLRIAREYQYDVVARPLARVYVQPTGLTNNHHASIAGTEALLEKYRDSFRQHPKAYGRRLQTLGTHYCLTGNTARGRQLFRAALAQDPTAMKSYLSLALSVIGATGFRVVLAARNRATILLLLAALMAAAEGMLS